MRKTFRFVAVFPEMTDAPKGTLRSLQSFMKRGHAILVVVATLVGSSCSRISPPGIFRKRGSPSETDGGSGGLEVEPSVPGPPPIPSTTPSLPPQLDRCLRLLKRAPRRSACLAFLTRMLLIHIRARVEKHSWLKEFRSHLEHAKPSVTIVTTAALPWKTGTAVNALLRAAYLAAAGYPVTLCLPWIHPDEQKAIFPAGLTFDEPAEQELAMLKWLAARDGEGAPFQISWYPARYDHARGSILPLGDATKWLGTGRKDLCVLEEPEHLTWYHGGRNWRRCFKLVVGVVHTNYISYAKMYQPENVGIVRMINNLVCRAYTDRIVKLSDCLQALPRAAVCNVHGVRSEFVETGRQMAAQAAKEAPAFSEGAYFIGKVLWAKGHRLLIEYLKDEPPASAGAPRTRVDIYGTGEDLPEVEAAAEAESLNLRFCGGRDHADASLHAYKVFVNPSQTEVLSTTTAEALAMGKFVIIERNPSNEFFYGFSNVRTYSSPEEFRAALREALAGTPAPLSEEESHALSWAGGTERFVRSVADAAKLATPPSLMDGLSHASHQSLGLWNKGYFGDFVKKYVFESGPVSRTRWLHKERKWRTCTSVTAVVEKSLRVAPPRQDAWERYAADSDKKGSWTRFVPGSRA